MYLELLEELCHEHGVLPAGDTDGDIIAFFNHIIFIQRLDKGTPDFLAELLYNTAFNLTGRIRIFLFFLRRLLRLYCHCLINFFRQFFHSVSSAPNTWAQRAAYSRYWGVSESSCSRSFMEL